MADFTIKEFKRGSINIKQSGLFNTFNDQIFNLSESLFGVDTYFVGDPVCFGNDCGAFMLYNVRLDKVYYITDYDFQRLNAGRVVKILPFTPDADQREIINERFN